MKNFYVKNDYLKPIILKTTNSFKYTDNITFV